MNKLDSSLTLIGLGFFDIFRFGGGAQGGDNSYRLGYRMCHFLRVLFWLKNKFLGLFYSLQLNFLG